MEAKAGQGRMRISWVRERDYGINERFERASHGAMFRFESLRTRGYAPAPCFRPPSSVLSEQSVRTPVILMH